MLLSPKEAVFNHAASLGERLGEGATHYRARSIVDRKPNRQGSAHNSRLCYVQPLRGGN